MAVTQKVVLGTVEQVALALGAPGSTAVPVDSDHPIPVTLAAGDAESSGLATEAKQDNQITQETAAATSLAVIDDWDESDRAKVNPIVGVAGVAAGAGAVGTTTQRMTLASDDPAVTSLGVMDDWDESDRAKVNIIAGQVAITAGAGAVAANTPRVTLASDDPLVARIPATLGPKTPALSLSVIQSVLTPFAKAAGLTTSPFGATGAAGDYLSHVILQPAAVGAGTTTIFNNTTAVYVYTAGTLADLRPIVIPINALSVGGSWNITTGANMAATGFGTFT